MKILIACDKFRGSLEGNEVARFLSEGILEINQSMEILTSPVADGGEGSLDVLSKSYNAEPIQIEVKNAVGNSISADLGYNPKTQIAVLEMASYVGLGMLKGNERNPMKTSSYGLGQAIKKSVRLGAKTIIIGIGGSATNDGGAGALEALGYRFFDGKNKSVTPNGGNLNKLEKIVAPDSDPLKSAQIIIACDVNNPICGHEGASYVYGNQKGAKDSELPILDDNLGHFSKLVSSISGNNVLEKKGYGAAGGVSLSLCELLGAELKSGSELIFESLGLESLILESDVIITGEGKIDHQTGHGKAISPIVEHSLKYGKQLYLVCGIFEEAGDQILNNLPRFELVELAREIGLDSFIDADQLTLEVGRRIAKKLK